MHGFKQSFFDNKRIRKYYKRVGFISNNVYKSKLITLDMHDKKYEKEKAKALLVLIEEYTEYSNKQEINKKLNEIAGELYYNKRLVISQAMIDVALAIHSFTQAAMSGGHFQPLDEFIPDLQDIIKS